ncbi:MAG: hypothetical protein KGK01_04160 [Bradyrhizobium sp.]|uniref:hypothetical protein n=1 Tax=Bradyrhizobium sp. TaxID=376 RepID=UPI00238FDF7A|nr:hypothetical protein [Bradyrhizobium sp.]MDE2067459.1 hypothetical protein [Bradyrhizobium sp.]MDE2241653.1 hypothetical protein [Bradyrhizobium sp.]
MLALGKDGKAYLLDRNNLGGIGGQLAAETVSETRIITSPAAYRVGNDVFVAFQAPGAHCPTPGRGRDLTVLRITAGSLPAMSTAWCGALRGRGFPIVTTTDGHSNPIVWMLGAEGDNRLHAFRGDTGEPIFASAPWAVCDASRRRSRPGITFMSAPMSAFTRSSSELAAALRNRSRT